MVSVSKGPNERKSSVKTLGSPGRKNGSDDGKRSLATDNMAESVPFVSKEWAQIV